MFEEYLERNKDKCGDNIGKTPAEALRDYRNNEPHIKDSGARTEYETGAVRDIKIGVGRCDLLPFAALEELYKAEENPSAAHFYADLDRFKTTGKIKYLADAIIDANPFKDNSEMLLEVSKHFEEGAAKYGVNNWQKGIPVHSYIDSAIRHYTKYLGEWNDEPHDRAVIWNLLCGLWTMIKHPELDDFTEKEK